MHKIKTLFEGEESVLKKIQVEDCPVIADKKSDVFVILCMTTFRFRNGSKSQGVVA